MRFTPLRFPRLPRRRPSDSVVALRVGLALIVAGVISGTVAALAQIYATGRTVVLAAFHHWPVGLIAIGAVMAVVAIRQPGRRGDPAERTSWWFRHRWAMAAAAVLVVAAGLALTALATVVLAHLTGYYDQPPAERLSDLIKVALTITGGTGAAVALVVAYRRQKVTEDAHELAKTTARDTQFDAEERRITEQYTQAVEQLGHDKAPVRLGGLYALERVGQNTPDHRQVVVDVLCAYLRMPPPSTEARTARPPVNGPAAASSGQSAAARRVLRVRDRTSAEPFTGVDPREEHQVRLTAQRILADHLRDHRPADQRGGTPTDPRFWDGMTLDLTAATLTDLDLTDCHARDAWFDGATFTDNAVFVGATFTGGVGFGRARFTGGAWFGGATFTGDAGFGGATFTGGAGFGGATFTGDAGFGGATFTGYARFEGATFTRGTRFDGATFGGKVEGLLESDRFGGWTLGPVPDRSHLQQLVPRDSVPVASSGGPGAPAEPDGAPA
jgi:hypothetical protein